MRQEDVVIGQVYLTKDYDKFTFVKGNRSRKHAAKIKRSTEKVGQLMVPILVDTDFRVLDGQGRLTAWQEMGLPIPYVVTESVQVSTIREINNASTTWKTDDYIDSFAEMGITDYAFLRRMVDLYAGKLPKRVIQAVLSGRMACSGTQQIKDGDFQVTRGAEEINAELEFLASLKMPTSTRGRKEYLYPVLAFCYESEDICTEALVRQWEAYADMVSGLTDTKAAAEEIEKVYNYKRPAKNHVYIAHLYHEEAVRRSAAGMPGGGKSAWDK